MKETIVFKEHEPVRVEQPRVEARPHITHFAFNDELKLEEVRHELSDIQIETPLPDDTIILEPLPMIGGESPVGRLGEIEVKRRIRRQKESSPKSYTEKLLVISDLQLLRETNQEAVGALLKYMSEQAHTFTHIVLNGDIMDFSQQTGFRKDNQLGDAVTRDEQVAGRWFIDFVNTKFGHCKKVFMKGNHEQRYDNMYLDTTNGVQQYLRPFEEVFGLEGWEIHQYGKGESYDWHGRKIRHGTRTGKQNIGKLEMDDSWRSTTVGHAVTNKMWEFVDADGNSFTSFVHAGFSQTADYDKTGNKTPSNGFGVYYYGEVKGKKIENAYQVIMPANNPRFISPEGTLYDGAGFNLRQEIGLDAKRGRPRKIWK